MKKHAGFTLIELMIVMAIIAILAVAGLAAYTGYIKKARDTVRITDIANINKALLAVITQSGQSPTTIANVILAVKAINNGVLLSDPQEGNASCLPAIGAETGLEACGYYYRQCDGGNGFAVGVKFSTEANQAKYAEDSIEDADATDAYYSLGSCTAECGTETACVIDTYTLIKPAA